MAVAGMLFGWETVMTFVLVSVVYAVAVGEPSFGIMGPFAVGLALFAMVFAGRHTPFLLAAPCTCTAATKSNQLHIHIQCLRHTQLNIHHFKGGFSA